MKDVKLESYRVYENFSKYCSQVSDNKSLFLAVKYSYTDDKGNKMERYIPKIALPFDTKILPNVKTINTTICGMIAKDEYFIPPFDDNGLQCEPCGKGIYVMDEHENMTEIPEGTCFIDVVKKRAIKKMTISEIEKELGYKVEVISEEEKK